MSKEMEKLAEDIPEELIEKFIETGYEPRRQYRTVLDARRRAPTQIRLILSAVCDGELELPGEVGRYSLLPPGERTYSEWALDMHIEENAIDFIALCKEGER